LPPRTTAPSATPKAGGANGAAAVMVGLDRSLMRLDNSAWSFGSPDLRRSSQSLSLAGSIMGDLSGTATSSDNRAPINRRDGRACPKHPRLLPHEGVIPGPKPATMAENVFQYYRRAF